MTQNVLLETSNEDKDPSTSVVVERDLLVINDLTVSGPAAAAAKRCLEQDNDPEDCVRQMLEIGGMVLEHGANSTLVQAVIAEMRGEGLTQEAIREASSRLASKGLRYEERLQPILEAAFAPYGDELESTGGTPGVSGRSKKGDFVVRLNAESIGGRDRRVVIEAKDRPYMRMTGKTGGLTYLAEAMQNREATVGILVLANPNPALVGHRLRVYSGNRILVLFDKEDGDPLALEVACQLSRALAARASGEEDHLDAALMTEKVTRLREVIEQAHAIHHGVLETRRGIARVADAYEVMRKEALAVLHELEDRLNA